MRLLIHFVGDVHQPLHCTSRVNHQYPKGDFGGNLFKVSEKSGTGVDNLHAVWDSLLYEEAGYQDLPFSAADWESFGAKARGWINEYPVDDASIRDLNPDHWA